MPVEREMNPDHENALKCMFSLPQLESEPLPAEVVADYWIMKTAADRVSVGLTMHDLLQLAVSYPDLVKPPVEINVVDQWKRGLLKSGDQVEVLFKKKWQAASLLGLTNDNQLLAQVTADPEAEERRFDAKHVRVLAA